MADFFFVVRAFLVTVVLFLGMQIRIGSRTVEQHSVAWVHSSSFIESLQTVSDGAVHVIHIVSHKMTSLFTHVPAIGAESEAAHEARHRMGKRADVRKSMIHDTIAAEPKQAAQKSNANETAKDDGDEQRQSTSQDRAQGNAKTGSFRSFFDVKTVHDADSN